MKKLKVQTEVYSRVVGYFRPVAQWNNGKQNEFEERANLVFNKTALSSERCSCMNDKC